jgi:hypothetical protein
MLAKFGLSWPLEATIIRHPESQGGKAQAARGKIKRMALRLWILGDRMRE